MPLNAAQKAALKVHHAEVDKAREAILEALGGVEVHAGIAALGQASALMLAAYGDESVTAKWIESLRASIESIASEGISLDDVAERDATEH